MIRKCKMAFANFRGNRNIVRVVVRRKTQEVYDVPADSEMGMKITKIIETYYKKCEKEGKVVLM